MNHSKTILITGGTGLVGKQLQQKLITKGYNIKLLSSQKALCNGTSVFYWDIITQTLDENALENVDYIIHLAGANIAEKKWTTKQMQIIVDSRTITTKLLFNALKKKNHSLIAFISSSATGYYGAITRDKIFIEVDSAHNDFLGNTCHLWERSVQQINELNIRTVILRTGIVLTKNGGAIAKLIIPAKFGLSAALGSGKQYFPWIHIDDLCDMYIKAIEDTNIQGVYNAVAPQHITNKEFTKALATAVKKPYFLPNIPTFLLNLTLGKMAVMLLEGNKISCDKIQATNFNFKYKTIEAALSNIVSKK